MGKEKISENEYAKIVDLYKSGTSQQLIANMYGVCRDTLGKILKKNNIARNCKISKKEYENIFDMYMNGLSMAQIAEQYNVVQSYIAYIIKQFKIDYSLKKGLAIPISEYNKIVDLYLQGMSLQDISTMYNCSQSTVSSILKKMDVQTRPGGSSITISDVLQWEKMYLNGMSLQDIATEFKVNSNTISIHLKNIGVAIDRYTYYFNEHFFDEIDTAYKAYILGLLWADGHNCVKKGSIILELQEQDKELLLQINNITQNERPLRLQTLHNKNEKWQNQYKLTLQNRYTSSVLESYGMLANKSLVLEFPKCVPEELYSSFILGYFDGDGSISLSNNNRNVYISIVGTKMFLDVVAEIIQKNTGVNPTITRATRAKDPICSLRCNKKQDVIKLLNWLYKDSTIYLQRKYNKYRTFININNSYVD